MDRDGRHRAGVRRLPGLLRAGRGARLPGPDPGQPVQRGLLDPGHGPDRAAAAPDPQWHGRGRTVRGVGQGRVQPRPARDRVPLRGGGDHLRQPLDLQDRGEGDRGPGREQHHVHGQAERPRGKLLPHPPVPARCLGRRPGDGRRGRVRPVQAGRALPGRPARRAARAGAVLRAEHQLLQALRAGQLRSHLGPLGTGQPHLRAAAGRSRALAPGGEPGARRRREPVPGGRRDDRGRPARHRQRAAARAADDRQRLRRHHSARPAHPARRAGAVGEERAGPGGVRRGGGGALRQLRPGRADRLRGRGDRLGAAARLRATMERGVLDACPRLPCSTPRPRSRSPR